jgi:hypothetical protein
MYAINYRFHEAFLNNYSQINKKYIYYSGSPAPITQAGGRLKHLGKYFKIFYSLKTNAKLMH